MITPVRFVTGTGTDPPFGMAERRFILVDHGMIPHRHDSGFSQQSDRLSEKIPPDTAAVDMADPGGIVAVAVVVAGIDHRRFDSGQPDHLHIFRRIELSHILRLQIRDVIIDQKPGVTIEKRFHESVPFR